VTVLPTRAVPLLIRPAPRLRKSPPGHFTPQYAGRPKGSRTTRPLGVEGDAVGAHIVVGQLREDASIVQRSAVPDVKGAQAAPDRLGNDERPAVGRTHPRSTREAVDDDGGAAAAAR
jgi:hypothetical protein